MEVWKYITEKLKSGDKIHMTLLDPEKQPAEQAGAMAEACVKAGSDAVMVGGSTALDQCGLDDTVQRIKDSCGLPVILFPTCASCLSAHADAIFFMSMLNSKNLKYVVGEHKIGAPIIKKLGLEPIPMGYIVVEPGMKVGEIGEAELLHRNAVSDAQAYALAAQYLGMKLVYFEAGSGAPKPVPVEMVQSVSEMVEIPLVIGGGIRDSENAGAIAAAGADIVVTGTIVEETGEIQSTLNEIITTIKSSAKK